MQFLRQSTAVDVAIGPFLDATDAVTAETGLTIAQADVRLKKNNGAWAQVNDSTSATHEENGWYEKELDATDTNTVGILLVAIHESGALPVWHEFYVLEEAVFDAFFAASAVGYVANAPVNVAQFGGTNGTFASGRAEVNTTHWAGTAVGSTTVRADVINWGGVAIATPPAVNATQISGDSTAADTLESWLDGTAGAYPELGIIDQGTAQSATATTLVLRAATPFGSDDACIGATLMAFGSTQGYWQSRLITDYTTADDTCTVEAWDVTPSGTITYKVFGSAPSSSSSPPTAAQIADAVWDEDTTGHTTSGTFGEQLKTDVDAILVDTGTTLDGRLPAALVGGRMDANVGAISADSTAADNAEAFFDGTGYAGTNNVIPTVTTTTNLTNAPTSGDLTATMKASVNAEVLDVLNTDTFAEPGQGNPGATITLAQKIGYLYKAWRNRTTQTASEYALYADNGTTKDQEAAISDNGTTLDRSEVQTGA